MKALLFAVLARAAYDSSPIIPMQIYEGGKRTLNCWECFQALGKMCIFNDYTSMMRITGSSNFGHGVCCHPQSEDGICGASDSNHVCSPPSWEANDNPTPYRDVLSHDYRNYQMFAFCPMINRRTCGIDDSSSTDMSLSAGREPKTVKSDSLRYKEGRPDVREYDACYYQVSPVESASPNDRIFVEFSKLKEMNVYVYQGQSRFEARESIVPGNEQVIAGRNYTADASKGMLIVAYPNEYAETQFEFRYFVTEFAEKEWHEMITDWDFNSYEGDTVFLLFAVVAAILLLCLICLCFCLCRRCTKKHSRVQIIDDDLPLETISPRPQNGNDTSVQMDDEHEDPHQMATNQKPSKLSVDMGDDKKIDGKRYSRAKVNEDAHTHSGSNPFPPPAPRKR